MVGRRPRSATPAPGEVMLPASTVHALRSELPSVADAAVEEIIRQVPAYEAAFGGPMGETIRGAVQIALGGFLSLVSERRAPDSTGPRAGAIDGAYQLGRGEVRSGRTSDALLSAYRIGARVCWQRLSARAVAEGMDPATMASFAALVFAYIDELSAASVAGHRDESATEGRIRQRMQERLARHLLAGATEATLLASAERAEWSPPTTLTAVVVPESQLGGLQQGLGKGTLTVADLPDLEGAALVMIPDADGKGRAPLLRRVRDLDCHVGPPRPWQDVRASYDRALRTRVLGLVGDTEQHLPRLVLSADPDAVADLRVRMLAPLADLRPAAAAKLRETLRAWLLHQGRRDEVAAALFVHPQTIRYRMTQLRDLYGDRLEDPDTVLALTIALGAEEGRG